MGHADGKILTTCELRRRRGDRGGDVLISKGGAAKTGSEYLAATNCREWCDAEMLRIGRCRRCRCAPAAVRVE